MYFFICFCRWVLLLDIDFGIAKCPSPLIPHSNFQLHYAVYRTRFLFILNWFIDYILFSLP